MTISAPGYEKYQVIYSNSTESQAEIDAFDSRLASNLHALGYSGEEIALILIGFRDRPRLVRVIRKMEKVLERVRKFGNTADYVEAALSLAREVLKP